MFNSKSLGVIVTVLVTVPALVLGGIGAYNAFNVISSHVKDGSIQESDLKDVLNAKIKLPDGQILKTEIIFKDVDGEDVLGLTTEDGFWRVFVKDDALGVVPPAGGIGSEEIKDGSISSDDIGPEFLASVDGVSNDGGNVDFVGGTGVNVVPNDGADSVAFSVDFSDLDPVYVNVTGDTITGDLNVNGTTTVNDLVVKGSSVHYGPETYYDLIDSQSKILNTAGDLLLDDNVVVTGDVDAQDSIFNSDSDNICYQSIIGQVCTTGAVFVDDDLNVDGDVLVNGNQGVIGSVAIQDYLLVGGDTILFGDIYTIGDSYHFGEEFYYDDNRFYDDVWLGDGDEDRVVIAGPISSGDGDPLTIEDNGGLIVTRRDDPSINLFSVDGSGDAHVYGDLTVDGDITINGASYHNGVETYYDDIDAQDRILNTVGDLLLDDNVDVSLDLNVIGDSYLDSDVYLGTCDCDTIYAFGDFATDLDVDVTDTYDIGRNLVRWQDGFFSGRVLVGIDGAQTILRDNGLRTEGANLLLATTNAGEDIVLRPESDLVRVEGTVRPTDDGAYDLGSAARRWDTVYAYNLDLAGDITITGNSYHYGVEEYYDDIDAQDRVVNTIGDVLVDDNLDVSGDLEVATDAYVTGTATFYDGVNLGDTGTDIIGGFGRFGRDLTPSVDNSFNLGTAAERWDTLFAYDVDLLGTLTVEDLVVNNDASLGDASGWGGTDILSVDTTGANGPEACCAPTYEVTIDGDLKVTGAIDPTGILLEPVGNGDTAIQVNNLGGNSVFEVNENGRIESNGNIDLVGGLITSSKANGEVTINGQLTVTDLVVSGDAAFNGTAMFDTDATPLSSGVYALGTSLLRWSDIFAVNGDLSGDLSVTGTATIGTLVVGATNVSTELGNLASAIALLQTEDTNLDTRLDDLEVGHVTVGGVATGCTTLGSSCSFSVAPAGKTIVSFAASPIGTGNLRLRLDSNPSGATSVTVTVLGGGGDTLSGVSWVATVQ